MGVKSANQHLRVYVAVGAPSAAADQAALDALGVGTVTYIEEGTAVGVTAPPSGKDFRVFYKDLAGNVFRSPVIKAEDVVSIKAGVAAVPEVQQVDKLTIPTPVVGQSFIIKLRVPNYGGLISPQDEVFFYGNFTAKDTVAANVAAGLAASLKKAVDAAPVPFADVTVSGADITVTGIEQNYVRGKWDGRLVNFDLSLSKPVDFMTGATKVTVGNPGNGTGKQVASAEEFYAGYNEGYKNREGGYPYNTEPVLAADASKEYKTDTIIFKTKRDGSNVATQRQTIIVAHTPA